MNNKERILKRLVEQKHITIEEMFILQNSENNTVVVQDLTPVKYIHIQPNEWNKTLPYYLDNPHTIS